MSDEPVTFERDGETYIGQDPAWAGRCYEAAFEALTRVGEGRGHFRRGDEYVLGTVIVEGKDRREPHAWVEADGVVYDLTVTSRPFDRANFYANSSAIAIERYGADVLQAMEWHTFVTTIVEPFHKKHMPPSATTASS